MNIRLILTALWLAATVPSQSFAVLVSPDCVAIKASVTVPIARGDLDAARQIALANARADSVKRALSSRVLDLVTYRQCAEAIESSILQKPDPYVARCEIDSEDVLDDGQNYRLAVVAEVRQAALKAALVEAGIVEPTSLADKPKVLVLVKERFDTRVAGTRYCESQLVRLLRQKGFAVVDADQKRLLEQRERALAEATGDRGALMQSATAFPADYLLVGEAAITSSGPLAGTELKARMANLSLRIVETTTGSILAVVTGEGRSRHIDELTGGNWAMDEALKAMGPDLLGQLKDEIKKQMASGAPVTIDFYGIDQPSQRQQAQAKLQEIDRVTGVTRRFYVPGVTQFEVRFKGPVSELASEVQKLIVDTQPVEVLDTASRYLRVARGNGAPTVKAGAEAVLAAFAEEKFKDFLQEKLREANKEVIAHIERVAKDTRVNDEQRRQLFQARKEIERREREAVERIQELAQRRQELKAAEAEYGRTRTDLAQKPAAGNSVSAAPAANRPYTPPASAPAPVARASERVYVASQNAANAQARAGTAVVEEVDALEETVRAVNDVAGKVNTVVATARNVQSTVENVRSLFGGFGF